MKSIHILLFIAISTLAFSQEKPSDNLKVVEINEDSEEIPFAIIEKVPVYKGCDKTLSNKDLKKCMSDAISKHVVQNFNSDMASRLGLPDGLVRINVIFKINKKGKVVGIKSRAPHPDLEQEAIRVISLLPDCEKPGYQKGKPVIVPYSLPIVFNLESDNKPLNKRQKRRLRRKH